MEMLASTWGFIQSVFGGLYDCLSEIPMVGGSLILVCAIGLIFLVWGR